MKNQKNLTEEIMVKRMSLVSIIGNIILSIFKFVAGIFANSSAMISDAIHSLSDVLSTFIAVIGVKLSKRKEDKEHPYGHDRFECVASILLCALLFFVGCGIGYSGIVKVVKGNYESLEIPGMFALIAAIVSIIVKEWMFQYTRHYAKIANSSAFMADAWHHRSDALSSIGALIGIGGAMIGFPILEPISSVVICLFILKASIDIFKDALNKMIDTPCNDEYEKEIADYISSQDGILNLDLLKTRMFGNKIYVDAEIAVDGKQTLKEAHDIAENVHDGVENTFKNVKHIMIHVNPIN